MKRETTFSANSKDSVCLRIGKKINVYIKTCKEEKKREPGTGGQYILNLSTNSKINRQDCGVYIESIS